MVMVFQDGEHADTREFLRERLSRGNECLRAGNARGALSWYDSALSAFDAHGQDVDFRDLFRALWNNKAIAHEHLGEAVQATSAMNYAVRLTPSTGRA